MQLSDIAKRIGVTMPTIRAYNGAAAMNRRNGTVAVGDLPEPDGKKGKFPFWETSKIEAWIEQRPGRGNYERGSK